MTPMDEEKIEYALEMSDQRFAKCDDGWETEHNGVCVCLSVVENGILRVFARTGLEHTAQLQAVANHFAGWVTTGVVFETEQDGTLAIAMYRSIDESWERPDTMAVHFADQCGDLIPRFQRAAAGDSCRKAVVGNRGNPWR